MKVPPPFFFMDVTAEPVTVPTGEDVLLPHERMAALLHEREQAAARVNVTLSLQDIMLLMFCDDTSLEGVVTQSNSHDGPQNVMKVARHYGELFKLLDPTETHLTVFLFPSHAEVWRTRNWKASLSCRMQARHSASLNRLQRNQDFEAEANIAEQLIKRGIKPALAANLASHIRLNPDAFKELRLTL